MRLPERMRHVALPIYLGVPVGRQRDWIHVPMGAPTVWMATPDGLACLDLIAVERALNGLRGEWTLSADEAFYAATVGFAHGLTYSVICERLGVSGSTMLAWFPGGKAEAAQAPRRSRQPAKCGTKAGYHRHYRHKEKPCEPCRAAKAVAHKYYREHGTYVGAPEVAA